MGKKHLLYIHNKRFADEKEKSKLVNDLLNMHYEGLSYQAKRPIIKPRPTANEAIALIKPILEASTSKTCKNGHILNHRGYCDWKGCK